MSTACDNTSGLTIEFNGQNYTSNTTIFLTDVGEGNEAVMCRTDLTTCCSENYFYYRQAQGEWLYPNNTNVTNRHTATRHGHDFYRTRGSMVVSLNRRNGATGPTGLYCCEVATMADPNARICITLGILKLYIASSYQHCVFSRYLHW